MVRPGTYKQAFEAHRCSFVKSSYSENESSVFAQAGRAPLPQFLKQKAAYLETSMPQMRPMLEEFAERALGKLHPLISGFPFLAQEDRS